MGCLLNSITRAIAPWRHINAIRLAHDICQNTWKHNDSLHTFDYPIAKQAKQYTIEINLAPAFTFHRSVSWISQHLACSSWEVADGVFGLSLKTLWSELVKRAIVTLLLLRIALCLAQEARVAVL
jgi:hypothetical protein